MPADARPLLLMWRDVATRFATFRATIVTSLKLSLTLPTLILMVVGIEKRDSAY